MREMEKRVIRQERKSNIKRKKGSEVRPVANDF